MRSRLVLFLVLLWAVPLSFSKPAPWPTRDAGGATQAPQGGSTLSVRLYWTQEISELHISPHGGELHLRSGEAAKTTTVPHGVTLRVDKGRLQMGGVTCQHGSVGFFGSYRLEVAGHPPVFATWPLMVQAEPSTGKSDARRRLVLTARMPLEDYVAAVLAGESGNFASDESLKAMAVAARTYAMRFRSRHHAEGFDLCDTTHCQDLRLGAVSDRFRGIAEATEGELLWYEGRLAATYYHRHCGGVTEAVGDAWLGEPHTRRPGGEPMPYLRRQMDGFCVARDRGEWQSSISKADLQRALALGGILVPRDFQDVEVVSRTPSGRVARLRLRGATSVAVTAEAFRLSVGRALSWEHIRSDLYDVRIEDERHSAPPATRFVFHGYGAGHGVGLCQVGAARMGETGSRHEQILSFYYPGATLGLTAQGLSWTSLGGERVEVLTTRAQHDRELVRLAERLVREIEQATGWSFRTRPQIRAYPTVTVFRDATGKPGWVAASTRGRVIRLQPVATLRAAGRLEETLRHELLHLLVESRVRGSLPLWFREGVVLVLSDEQSARHIGADSLGPTDGREDFATLDRTLDQARTQEEVRRAYRAAQARVEALIARHGRNTVLDWVERGLPPELGRGR